MNEESFTIVLPLPSKWLSPNVMTGSLCGRMAKASAAKKYRETTRKEVAEYSLSAFCAYDAGWKKIKVKPTFYYKQKRRRDTDNAIASLKSAYDGIVDAGLIPDDTPEHMKRTTPEFRVDKEYPRVEIEIIRLE